MKVLAWIKCRHVLSTLIFWGFFNVYTMRVNFSVAIVAMVKTSKKNFEVNESDVDTCPHLGLENMTRKIEGEFDWNENEQGIILSSFFYSYTIFNIIGGKIVDIIGAKRSFGFGILSTSLLTLLTPIAAKWNYVALILLRILEGAAEGITFPAIHCLIGRWFNKSERSFVVSFAISGTNLGAIVSMFVSGYLCESKFFGGWPSVFYVFGAIGMFWTIFWCLLTYDFPENHPRISKEEIDFIYEGREKCVERDVPVPWKKILTSGPVWACAFSALAKNWTFCLIDYSIPVFLTHILHYEISKIGVLTALPNVVELFATILAGVFSDWLLKKNILQVGAARKLLNSIGVLPSIFLLILITFSDCNRTVIITCLVISMGAMGICISGYATAIVDMSPPYSGILMGLINGFSQLSGIMVPIFVGRMTYHNQTIHQWNQIFYVSSAISAVALLAFAAFGSSDLQPWSEDENKKEDTVTRNSITIADPRSRNSITIAELKIK